MLTGNLPGGSAAFKYFLSCSVTGKYAMCFKKLNRQKRNLLNRLHLSGVNS